jgi:hypothetical protein
MKTPHHLSRSETQLFSNLSQLVYIFDIALLQYIAMEQRGITSIRASFHSSCTVFVKHRTIEMKSKFRI